MYLESIREPADLRSLSYEELDELAGEVRDFIVQAVAENAGHLGSNLGAVELTLAIHRVFESPRDAILWDTGHQAYVHKIVTGRQSGFEQLRQAGGRTTSSRTATPPRSCPTPTVSPSPATAGPIRTGATSWR
jgi:1-deoxy-D-xylulose-5-phosphate synthase